MAAAALSLMYKPHSPEYLLLPAASITNQHQEEVPQPIDDDIALETSTPAPNPTMSDEQLIELMSDSGSEKKSPPSPAVSPTTVTAVSPVQRAPEPLDQNLRASSSASEEDPRTFFQANPEPAPEPLGANNGLFFGGLPDDQNDQPAQIRNPTPTPSPTPRREAAWVRGQARGYAMLYAMHPKARPVVERQITALLNARIREPYVSILVDGTFNQDFDYIRSIISRLSVDGRRLTLALYMSNGPTMRIWNKTPIRTAFSNLNPLDFRRMIKWNERIRNQYAEIVDQSRGLFEFNLISNAQNVNIAIPMLEDNLDRDGYNAMRQIAAVQLSSIVTFMRNPCEGCFQGNDGDPVNDLLEEHRTEYFDLLRPDDGFTLDGLGFNYPNHSTGKGLSASELEALIDLSLQRNLKFFGLWRHAWQGANLNGPNAHPDQRNYVASTDGEIAYEISLLRRGLSEETQAQ